MDGGMCTHNNNIKMCIDLVWGMCFRLEIRHLFICLFVLLPNICFQKESFLNNKDTALT